MAVTVWELFGVWGCLIVVFAALLCLFVQWKVGPIPIGPLAQCGKDLTYYITHFFRCCWVLRQFLTAWVISVSSDIEREKSDRFFSEALISAWGSFTCRKSTTRDPRLYLPSEGSHPQDFYALENPSTPAGIEPANLGSRGEYDKHRITGVDPFFCLVNWH